MNMYAIIHHTLYDETLSWSPGRSVYFYNRKSWSEKAIPVCRDIHGVVDHLYSPPLLSHTKIEPAGFLVAQTLKSELISKYGVRITEDVPLIIRPGRGLVVSRLWEARDFVKHFVHKFDTDECTRYLYWAILCRDEELVSALLPRARPGSHGSFAVELAASTGHEPILARMMTQPHTNVLARNRAALHAAAANGQPRMLEMLLDHAAPCVSDLSFMAWCTLIEVALETGNHSCASVVYSFVKKHEGCFKHAKGLEFVEKVFKRKAYKSVFWHFRYSNEALAKRAERPALSTHDWMKRVVQPMTLGELKDLGDNTIVTVFFPGWEDVVHANFFFHGMNMDPIKALEPLIAHFHVPKAGSGSLGSLCFFETRKSVEVEVLCRGKSFGDSATVGWGGPMVVMNRIHCRQVHIPCQPPPVTQEVAVFLQRVGHYLSLSRNTKRAEGDFIAPKHGPGFEWCGGIRLTPIPWRRCLGKIMIAELGDNTWLGRCVLKWGNKKGFSLVLMDDMSSYTIKLTRSGGLKVRALLTKKVPFVR